MYESITYEELKSLPRDQKAEALKELKALYPTQKKIAEKLGVNPANIYNMIAKYAKDDDDGQPKAEVKAAGRAVRTARRKAGTKTDAGAVTDTKATIGSETINTQDRPTVPEAEADIAVTAVSETLTAAAEFSDTNAAETVQAEPAGTSGLEMSGTVTGPAGVLPGGAKGRTRRARDKKTNAEENLLITLSKSLTGEEAQALFGGISSVFLKNHEYRLEIRISER